MRDFVLDMLMKILDGYLTDERLDELKVQLIEALREVAQRSDNELDDHMVDILARFLEVDA